MECFVLFENEEDTISGFASIHTSLTNSAGGWRQNPIMTLQDKLGEAAPRKNTRSVFRIRYYVPSVPV
jgi:hypothetical protein